jgi:hypothetical protein
MSSVKVCADIELPFHLYVGGRAFLAREHPDTLVVDREDASYIGPVAR